MQSGHLGQNYSVNEIIKRLKVALNVSSDSELSEQFGYRRQAVNEWRKRNSIPLRTVFAKCGHLREEWILHGEGSMLKCEQGADDEMRQLCERIGRHVLDAFKEALPYLLGSGNKETGSMSGDEPLIMPTPAHRAGPAPFVEQVEELQGRHSENS